MASVAASVDLCKVALHKNHNWAAIEAYDASPTANKYTQPATLAFPPQSHMFVDIRLKEETHVANDMNLLNRFDVICRFCLGENECLLNIFGSDDCLAAMTESLVDVKIEADDMLPKQICTNCYELLTQCLAFKQQVTSTDAALRKCISQPKQVEIQNQNEDSGPYDPEITKQHIFDPISNTNEFTDDHKYEDLIEEEHTPGDGMVHKKNLNLYLNYDETPAGGDDDAIDYSPETKSKPVTIPSDAVESSPNVKRESRKSIKCEQCDNVFSCNSHLQEDSPEKLKYQCNTCSFSQQTGLKSHMSRHKSPSADGIEQTNTFKCATCNASFAVERDLCIHGSIPAEDDRTRCRQGGKNFSNLAKLRRNVQTYKEEKAIKCEQGGRGFTQIASLSRHSRVLSKKSRDRKHVYKECSKPYLGLHALSLHYRKHTSRKPRVCTKCNKRFSDTRLLNRHMRRHTNVRNFRCTACQKGFTTRDSLSKHMRLHTGEKPFICNVCNKSFILKSYLIHHMRVHSGEKPYKCSHCPKSFGQSSTLTVHVRTHTGEKPYKCPHCSKSFGSSTTLTVHIRTHTGEKPFKCPHCSKSFGSSSKLRVHVRTHTGEKPCKCSLCPKSFGSSSALIIHVRTHTGEKPYKCPNCSKSFGSSAKLGIHARTHSGEKPYKCSHCPKSFGTSSALAVHVRSHTGEKPYKCHLCSKSFGSSTKLIVHIRTHTGEKPYNCSHCSKKFGTSSALAVHIRSHTGEKPYKCPHCSKTFRTSSGLPGHVRTHTGERPYKCSHCSKSFGRSTSLAIHIRSHTCEKPNNQTTVNPAPSDSSSTI